MIRYEYDLDVVPGNVPVMVPLKQYEDAYELVFHLFSRIGGFSIPANTTVFIRGTKPDGNGISIDATLSGYDVTVNVIKQMTVVAGKGAYELVLTKEDGTEFITATFYLMVQRASLDSGTLTSESSIKELADVITRADEIIAAANRVDTAYAYVSDVEERLEASVSQAMQDANNAMNEAANAATEVDELKRSDDEMRLQIANKFDGAFVEQGSLYMTSNGEVKEGPLGPFAGSGGGGSGGSGNNAILKVTNASGFMSKTIASGDTCELSLWWSSTEDDLSTGDGTLTIIVSGKIASTQNVAQGDVKVDVAKYLNIGSNVVSIRIADIYSNSRTISFSIQVLQLSITSTFDSSVPYYGAIPFAFTPIGAIQKTIHFIVDGKEKDTMVTAVSNRQQSWTIPAQSHGSHSFEIYFDCEVNGSTVESNHLYYELICLVSGNNKPIISSSFNTKTAKQYSTIYIPWICYDPASLTREITLLVNGTQVSKQVVDRSLQVWAYRVNIAQAYEFTIDAGSGIKKVLNLDVTETKINVEAETQDLELFLSSYGRSNNEEDPSIWEYEGISATLENFNWVSNGWLPDNDGITVLRVSGDARVTIPFKIFESDFRATGKTIELEFATRNITNDGTVILSCMDGNRGVRLTTQVAEMRSELTRIFSQYKEDEHVRVSFVVQKKAENRLMQIYINGVMSGAIQYPENDNFTQANPMDIVIGSDECATDIYNIRVYSNNLSKEQILNNWIADTQLIDDMLDRYYRNNIYDAYGNVTISNLPGNLPYLVIESEVLPQHKGDKKTCSGRFVNPTNTKKSFTFENAQFDVQGTSSQFYYRKNYKGKFRNGFKDNNENVSGTYAMNDKAIPVNTFCFKADVASSEGANNVELVRLYCDTAPVNLAEALGIENVRWGIDGFPIVVFWDNGSEITFLGKYNFNNDKSTNEVFGLREGDESWEIKNNTGSYVIWKNDDFSGDAWKADFESRYPEDYYDTSRLQPLASWIKSTDAETATDVALAEPVNYEGVEYTIDSSEYRLAKFKNELGNYFDVDMMCFNTLFTETFLMADNRAKNVFPTYYVPLRKWVILPYDYDTGIGINNEGGLVFGYSLEDTDLTEEGAYVFNGQNSVLFVNMRKCFYDKMKELYKSLRAAGKWSYDVVIKRFKDHQSMWPEAIFNEDAQVKYLDPLILDGDSGYLSMLQGSKEEQRKWWLFNRFRYLDAKYVCGDAVSSFNVITFRGYALGAGISMVPFVDTYAAINWANSHLSHQRAYRNVEVYFENPLEAVNDSEIYIYNASSLAAVGDLAPMKVGYANFSYATRIQVIKIGDAAEGYSNNNLNELYLGNNTLLKSLDVRNCPNLGNGKQQSIDLTGCVNIEEVYFAGTSIKGVSFANGCTLNTLQLPNTIVNLTLRNLKKLTNFQIAGYSNITTLVLENNNEAIDTKAILGNVNAGARIRILGFRWEFATANEAIEMMDVLDTYTGVDENGNNADKAQVSGVFFIPELTGAELSVMRSRYPFNSYEYNNLTSYLYFYNGDELIYTETILNAADSTYSVIPTKESTPQYSYTFVGWSTNPEATEGDPDALKAVESDRTVYAIFAATLRTYTVTFANVSGAVLYTVYEVPYGGTAICTVDNIVYDGAGDPTEYVFAGTWLPSNVGITGDTKCVAQYRFLGSLSRKLLSGDLSGIMVNDTVMEIGLHAMDGLSGVTEINFSRVTKVADYGCRGMRALSKINLPVCTKVSSYSFQYAGADNAEGLDVNLPSVNTTVGDYCFSYSNVKIVRLPKVTALGQSSFEQCKKLKIVYLKDVNYITDYAFKSASQLKAVVIAKVSPPTLYSSGFYGSTIESGNGYVYVPRDYVDAYKAATNWSNFAEKIRALEDYTVDGTITGDLDETKI